MKSHISKFSPAFQKVLKKMCKIVNADPNTIDFGENNWYYKYSWSKTQENEFKEWFYNFLKKPKNYSEIYEGSVLYGGRKYFDEKIYPFFMLQYGWKTRE